MPPLGNKIKKKPQVRDLWGNGFEDKIIENLKSETIKALHPSPVILKSPVFIGIPGKKVKGEG